MAEPISLAKNNNKRLREKITNKIQNLRETVAEKPRLRGFFQLLPLLSILIVALIIRVFAARASEGFIHPDEVFQSLEMIHFRLFGQFGTGETVPWEFNEKYDYGGARSWFFVMVLATFYKFLMALGVTDNLSLIFAARLFLALCSLITVFVAYLFGRDIFNKKVGLIAAFLCAIWWFFPFWGSRTMTDSLASDLLFVSIYLTYKVTKENKTLNKSLQSFFAGITLGFAFMLRFPSGLLGFPLLAFLLTAMIRELKKRKKEKTTIETKKTAQETFFVVLPLLCFLGATTLMIIIQGLLDLFTWGSFLQAPINFFMYNIVEGNSAIHGVAPWYSYFVGFYTDFANGYLLLFMLFLVIGLSFKEQHWAKIVFGTVFLFWLLVFSAIAHKEFRFIFILLPFSMIFVANGIVKFAENFKTAPAKRLSLVFILLLFCLASSMMAFYHQRYAWKANSGICNAMYWVGKQEDAQRVVVFEMVWYTGGYAYLDKNISCFFVRISPSSIPQYTYNSTTLRNLYGLNGTYVVVREPELYLVQDLLSSFNMSQVAVVGQLPNVYVFKQ
ncbi:MAG: glycosyltransferase family 39 protein [Candidatus Heimdallarchaeota archaeon]|nr:glycosyltransferase family 39 protein [Candidatus Heimdallarchaeota archaeon]